MNTGDFLRTLSKLPAEVDLQELVNSLHQDPAIWGYIKDQDHLDYFAGTGVITTFEPGYIAMHSIGKTSEIDSISAEPLAPVKNDLRQKASTNYQKVLLNALVPSGLSDSAYIAIAIRERKRLTGTWAGLIDEIVRATSSHNFDLAVWETPFILLYSWFNADFALRNEMRKSQGYLTAPEYYRFMTMVVLSRPSSRQEKFATFIELFSEEDLHSQVSWLKIMNEHHNSLPNLLAEELIETYEGSGSGETADNENSEYGDMLLGLARRSKNIDPLLRLSSDTDFSSLDYWLELYRIAGRQDQFLALLDHKNRMLADIQSGLKAIRLRNSQQSYTPAELINQWSDLAEKTPGSVIAQAELITAKYLAGIPIDVELADIEGQPENTITIARAILADRNNDFALTNLLIDDIVSSAKQDAPALKDAEKQISVMIRMGYHDKAREFARIIGEKFITTPEVYNWMAQIEQKLGNHTLAAENARTGLLLDKENLPARRLLAVSLEKSGNLPSAFEQWQYLADLPTPDKTDLLNYSRCAIANSNPDAAIRTCEMLVAKGDSGADELCILGDAHLTLGNLETALQYFNKAVTIAPENDHGWLELARYQKNSGNRTGLAEILATAINACRGSASLASMMGEYYLDEGAFVEATPFFKSACALEPDNLSHTLKFASTLQSLGQNDNAISVYEKALGTYPDNADLLVAYTNLLTSTGDAEKAIEPLLKLVRQKPSTLTPFMDLAITALTLHKQAPGRVNLEEVNSLLEDGMNIDPMNQKALLLNADLLSALGHEEKARVVYSHLAENADLPADLRWRVNYGLGMLSKNNGQIDVALAALEEAGDQNPENYEIQQKLAETYAISGLAKAAMDAAQHALAISPTDLNNLVWYSDFCLKNGNIPEALGSLTAAIQQKPDQLELRLKLGEIQLKLNDVESAKVTFNDLLQIGVISTANLRHIARLLAARKETGEAIAFLEYGIRQDPVNSLPLLIDLANYKKETGNLSEAVDSINQAIALEPENQQLALVRADLLAFAGDIEGAIYAMQDIHGKITSLENNATTTDLINTLLRLAFLHRKAGNLENAAGYAAKILDIDHTVEPAQLFLADIAYNQLQISDLSSRISNDGFTEPVGSQTLNLYKNVIAFLAYLETGNPAYKVLSEHSEFSDRWYLWHSSMDLLAKPLQSRPGNSGTLFKELTGHQAKDIYSDLPLADYLPGDLPDIPAYNLILSSPTLLHLVTNGAMACSEFTAAAWLVDCLQDQYPFEPSTAYFKAKFLAIRAETYRHYASLQISSHSPGSDSVSVEAFDQFNDALMSARRSGENPLLSVWETRGTAAFQPSREHLEKVADLQSLPVFRNLHEVNYSGTDEISTGKGSNQAAELLAALTQAVTNTEGQDVPEPVNLDSVCEPVILAEIAFVAHQNGNSSLAIIALEKAISEWPTEPGWHSFAADLYLAVGDHQGALAHLKAASELKPDDYAALLRLGKAFFDFGEIDQSIRTFRLATGLKQSDDEPWYWLAKAYRVNNDIIQAMTSVDRAISLSPKKMEPLALSAELALLNGQLDLAIQKIDAALRIDPRDVNALTLKVKTLRALDDDEEANRLIDYALTKVAKPLPLLIERADLIRARQGNKAYLATLQKISDDYPRDPDLLRLYSLALAENGYPSEALNITQLALKIDPDQPDLHILAGRLLRTTGQLDQSLDHINKALSLDHQNMDGYLELAKTHEARRDYARAVSVYEQAIDLMPRDHRPYYHLGLAYKDARDYKKAEGVLRKAAELSKDDVNVLRQLGAIIAINLVHPS